MISTEPSINLFAQNAFWDELKCRMLCELAETSQVEEAGIYRNGKIEVDAGFRKTRRILLNESLFAEIKNSFLSIKPQLEDHFQIKLQGLQGVQFLQYRPGDYFHTHIDECDPVSESSRKVSIILFLNTTYKGGEVVLYKDRNQFLAANGFYVTPENGLLIAFSSYLFHEVKEVITGVRYSLVSWFY